VAPPRSDQIAAVDRVRIDGHIAGKNGTEEEGRPLHVIAGGDEPDRGDPLPDDQFAGVEGIFQGIAGNVLQHNPVGGALTGSVPIEFALADQGIDTDEQEPLPPLFAVEPDSFVYPAQAACQDDNGIRGDVAAFQGKGLVGEIDKQNRHDHQADGQDKEESLDEGNQAYHVSPATRSGSAKKMLALS